MKIIRPLLFAAISAATLFAEAATAKSPAVLRHPDKRTTEIPLPAGGEYLMLPIEEGAPEVQFEIFAGERRIQLLQIRLAQFEMDYFMPFRPADYPTADRIRVGNLHQEALVWKQIYASDHYGIPDEPFRPAYHFAPAYGWMNDPNGMFFLDGVWHLYYQHNPYGAMWGNMHWGAASSRDLISWEHHGDVLCPDELGTIFSGSAVVDHDNTAGFGKGAVIAFYTSAGRYQQQSMAWSTDGGKTFTKYEGNPVVKSELADCRDPKVFWYAPAKQWNMILAVGNHMEIYSSKDLREWRHESDFGASYGCHDGVWECPDLFELPVDGNPGDTRWVLLSNNYSNTMRSGGTQYFIGTFDGREFRCETPADLTRWLDKGRNHYAAVTWDNAPDGRRVLLAWMAGWPYQNPGKPVQIRGIQSAPRDLALYTHDGTVYLAARPSPEMEALRGAEALGTPRFKVREPRSFPLPGEGLCEVELTFRDIKAAAAGFRLTNSLGEALTFRYDTPTRQFVLDFSKSGKVDYGGDPNARSVVTLDPRCAGMQAGAARETYAPVADDGSLALRILLDRCSVECFERDGRFVITDYIFPSEPYDRIEFFAEEGDFRIAEFAAYPLAVPSENNVLPISRF